MMKVRFNAKRMNRNVMGLDKNFKNGIALAFIDIGKVLVDDLHKQTQMKKSGRLYRIKGRLHRASAPKQTPANISGNYYQSTGTSFKGWDQMEFGNSAEYADWLEHGTRKMAPRFGLLNSIKAKQNQIGKIFDASLAKRIGK